MKDTILFLELVTKREIPVIGQDLLPNIEYCSAANDFAGMGIGCAAVVEVRLWERSSSAFPPLEIKNVHSFFDDNLPALDALIIKHKGFVTFGGNDFHVPILSANAINVAPPVKHFDVKQVLMRASGFERHTIPMIPSLSDWCRANWLRYQMPCSKAEAPRLWQRGKFGTVMELCFARVHCLIALFDLARTRGVLVDPSVAIDDRPRSVYVDKDFRAVFR